MKVNVTNSRGPRWAVVIAESRRSLLHDIVQHLRRAGESVTSFGHDEPLLSSGFEAVLLGRKDAAALEWGRVQQLNGAFVIPDPRASAAVRDRIAARATLCDSGFETPTAVSGTPAVLLAANAGRRSFPVVVKRRYAHGRDVSILASESALHSLLEHQDANEELLIESAIDGCHFTGYFIGDYFRWFARRPFGSELTETPVVSFASGLCQSMGRIPTALGLRFGKMDVVCPPSGPHVVVDVGAFPKFINIDRAACLIARVARAAAVVSNQTMAQSLTFAAIADNAAEA